VPSGELFLGREAVAGEAQRPGLAGTQSEVEGWDKLLERGGRGGGIRVYVGLQAGLEPVLKKKYEVQT
jgi:hypothetical protein